jgi:hypothetical protein
MNGYKYQYIYTKFFINYFTLPKIAFILFAFQPVIFIFILIAPYNWLK